MHKKQEQLLAIKRVLDALSERELHEQLAAQQNEITNLRRELRVAHTSTPWMILFFLKNPKDFLQRVTKRIELLCIRASSKFRRTGFSVAFSQDQSVESTNLSSLNLHSNPIISSNYHGAVDVIIPVFNCGKEVIDCVGSVLLHSPQTTKILLIDDRSTDPVLLKYYSSIKNHSQITIHVNEKRKGFVANINTGFHLTKNDVVILNTDTIVTKNWIKKLSTAAYSKQNVGTVTPLTNNGEIMSIPNFLQPNELNSTYTLEEQNSFVERFGGNQQISLPTGVGFCMYIRRETISAVGDFDEKAFGMGYGEENDFCQRAIRTGYINIVDDATFIYHKGTSSFQQKDKTKLIQNHLRIIFDRYPLYERQVHSFIEQNPLRFMQRLFKLTVDKPVLFSEPAILLVIHKNPFTVAGGVEVDTKKMLEKIGKKPLFFILHRDDNASENKLFIKAVLNGEVIHEFVYQFKRKMTFLDIEHQEITYFFEWFLKAFSNIKAIHLEHTYALPLASLKVFQNSGKSIFLNIHDFYYLCPYEKLINSKVTRFVNIRRNVTECYLSLASALGSQDLARAYQQYRDAVVTDFFRSPTITFIFNSKYSLQEYSNFWPKIFSKKNSIVVEPYA